MKLMSNLSDESVLAKCESLGVNVSIYANRSYHSGQIQMIRKGLEQHIDISKYADPRVPLRGMIQMYQKLCKQKGVPVK